MTNIQRVPQGNLEIFEEFHLSSVKLFSLGESL